MNPIKAEGEARTMSIRKNLCPNVLLRCPWLIRGTRKVQQFVGNAISTNDDGAVQVVLEDSSTYSGKVNSKRFLKDHQRFGS
jgi:hypothetical protein